MYIKIEGSEISAFANKEIILFGASSTGMKALEEFEQEHSVVIGFCDNNRAKRGTKLCGYEIYSPEDIQEMALKNPSLSIMITSTYDKEIFKQLKEMGLKNVYIVKTGVLHEKLPYSKFTNIILNKKEANQKITGMIQSKIPFFIGRIGSVELEILCNYKYFTGRIDGTDVSYTRNIKDILCKCCGFFPAEDKLLDQFCEIYFKDIKEADLLWSMWESKYEDKLYHDCCPGTKLALYDDTGFPISEPLPWTSALEDKKVLVVHPFEKSIQNNYKQRDKLFTNKNFMPGFELVTLKAVQTIADNRETQYKDWFEALDSMKKSIEQTDFDIALIGAGAYGFPLGAYVKKLGRQALHIGGMLQLYFGIRGKYYDQFQYHNEYWTRPTEEEKPKGFEKVEAGRYW
ncbi:MAG: hypothetical protein K1W24_01005 [Lachnospiraceae bacterium]